MAKLSEGKRIVIAGLAFLIVSFILSTKFDVWVAFGGATATAVSLLIILEKW